MLDYVLVRNVVKSFGELSSSQLGIWSSKCRAAELFLLFFSSDGEEEIWTKIFYELSDGNDFNCLNHNYTWQWSQY